MDALLPIRGIHSLPRAPSRRQLPPAWGRAQRLNLSALRQGAEPRSATETTCRPLCWGGTRCPWRSVALHLVCHQNHPERRRVIPAQAETHGSWVPAPAGMTTPPRPSFSAMALRHRPLANSVLENLIAAAAGVACRGTGFALCTMPAAAPRRSSITENDDKSPCTRSAGCHRRRSTRPDTACSRTPYTRTADRGCSQSDRRCVARPEEFDAVRQNRMHQCSLERRTSPQAAQRKIRARTPCTRSDRTVVQIPCRDPLHLYAGLVPGRPVSWLAKRDVGETTRDGRALEHTQVFQIHRQNPMRQTDAA